MDIGRLVGLAALLLVAGCATGPDRWRQEIAVSTATAAGEAVEGVDCELSNDKGRWTVVTPGRVTVRRSHAPLALHCTHALWQPVAGPDPSIAARGAALKGGAIGAAGGVALGASTAAAGSGILAAAAAGPLMIAAVIAGAGVGMLAGHVADEYRAYPETLVVVVEPRPAPSR